MQEYTGEVEIITNIGTTPNERGLTTEQFKAKFDEGLKNFVAWFNDTHKTEFDAHLADSVTDAGGAHGLKIETGTFMPYIYGTTSAGTNSYTHQFGYYTIIKNRVYFDIYLKISTKDSVMAGEIRVGGLPFVAKNGNLRRIAVSIGRIDYLAYGAAKQIIAWISQNESNIRISKVLDDAGIGNVLATDIGLLIINLSGNYEI